MSNLGPLTGPAASRVPTPPRGETIARYETYLEAQRAVDYLSDQQFPVQFVTIVGTGLRMVERVTGRLTYPRVAGASALSGLYFGFFVGLALSLFGGGGTDLSILAVAFVGAGFGMLFGIISYGMTRGRRDFTSTSQIVASEYEVLCMPEQAQHARELLWQLPGGRGREQSTTAPGPNPGQPGGPYPGGPYPGGPY
ncbi:MAG TPA: general stress protein, partial [Kineosporiaceae bacterium]|nr:general stress protein [Kineosporiaceae bacterium]